MIILLLFYFFVCLDLFVYLSVCFVWRSVMLLVFTFLLYVITHCGWRSSSIPAKKNICPTPKSVRLSVRPSVGQFDPCYRLVYKSTTLTFNDIVLKVKVVSVTVTDCYPHLFYFFQIHLMLYARHAIETFIFHKMHCHYTAFLSKVISMSSEFSFALLPIKTHILFTHVYYYMNVYYAW